MRKLFLFPLLLAFVLMRAQTHSTDLNDFTFSYKNAVILSQLPEIKLSEISKNHKLPAVVDNSQLPWFRPIFNQIGASCGQAASVGYAFTYEMCRLRGLHAADSNNQFPSHFAYNFMNYNGLYGVNYMHSFEVLKAMGTPTLADYGGMGDVGNRIWMTGYENYHKAMKNRLKEVFQLDVSTPEGLNVLKHWLDHRNQGAESGGVALFNAASPWQLMYLPQNTPEAGKRVAAWFPGNEATHAMTIVGYNDSIRYDYNGDGEFTNHLDLNGDGVLDMRDWEIGGLKFANSYGDNWADEGYAYMMYKTLAEDVYDGGIWNHVVHMFDVHETYEPMLTMKLKLKHSRREQIRIVAGISTDTTLSLPEHRLHFPAFNYQGGPQYMQGGSSVEAHKTIEIGLDISPLLSYAEPGMPADFYLEVYENDPYRIGSGEIISYAIRDYTANQPREIVCGQADIPLSKNSVTRLKIKHQADFDKVMITTSHLPAADSLIQLDAEGGKPPYRWQLETKYHQQFFEAEYPETAAELLSLEGPNYKFARKTLDFDFPFYGETYDEIFMHRDGFLLFEPSIYPWPYYKDTELIFRSMKHISAFLFAPIQYYPGRDLDHGLYYEGDETHATFRWRQPLVFFDETIGFGDFAITLYPDGHIAFFYNEIEVREPILWFAGVSAGNSLGYQLLHGSNTKSLPAFNAAALHPEPIPNGISLTEDGLLFIDPDRTESFSSLHIRVADDALLHDQKRLQLSSGLLYDYYLQAENDQPVHSGSRVTMALSVENNGEEPLKGLSALYATDDPYVDMRNDLATIGTLQPGEQMYVQDAFQFSISTDCPEMHTVMGQLSFNADAGLQNAMAHFQVRKPNLKLTSHKVDDQDDQRLDPGETAPLRIALNNSGSFTAWQTTARLITDDPYIMIRESNGLSVGTVEAGGMAEVAFTIYVAESCPIEHMVHFTLLMEDGAGNQWEDDFSIRIGQYPFLVFNKAHNSHSADAMMQVLDSLHIEYVYSTELPDDMDMYRAVLLTSGHYQQSYNLSIEEGGKLVTYLQEGGNLYMEGAMVWQYAPNVGIQNMFHTQTTTISPTYTLLSVKGAAEGFAEAYQFDYVGDVNALFYHFVPSPPAFPVFYADQHEHYVTAVAYGNGVYKTLGSIIEFSRLGSDVDFEHRIGLMAEIIRFFEMGYLFSQVDEKQLTENDSAIRLQAAPNPFVETVRITIENYDIDLVDAVIIDITGQTVKRISKTDFVSRQNSMVFSWNGRDQAGNMLPAGMYLLQIYTGSHMESVRLLKTE